MAFVHKTLVPVQFGGGINTKVDPKQLNAGQLLTLQDGQFSKTGQINKRYGYNTLNTNIQTGSAIANGEGLATYNDELLLFDGNNVYSYLESTGNWSNRGTVISVITTDKDIIRESDAQQLNPDMNYLNGIEVFVWEDSSGGVRYTVLDQITGAVIVSNSLLNIGGQQPKVLVFSGYIVIFYCYGTNLYYQTINPATPTTIGSAVSVASDGYNGFNGFPYDVHVAADGNLYLAWLSSYVATGQISASYLTSAFVQHLSNPAVDVCSATSPGYSQAINGKLQYQSPFHGAINVVSDSLNHVWVSWADGYYVNTAAYTTHLSSVVLAATEVAGVICAALAGIESPSAGVLQLHIENSVAAVTSAYGPSEFNQIVPPYTSLGQILTYTITTAGVCTEESILLSVGIAAKPFVYNGNWYITGSYESYGTGTQSTDFTFLMGNNTNGILTYPIVIAQETPGVGGGYITNGMVPETVSLESGIFVFANLQSGKILSEGNTLFSLLGVNSTTLNFATSDQFITTTQANTLLIVGGILQGYDGVSVTELGFLIYPENIQAVITSTTGGSLSQGTYQYCATYSWTDNNGQIYESAPSIPVSITTTNATSQVTIDVCNLRLTNRSLQRSQNIINIYRTQVNGTTFNMVTSVLAPIVNTPLSTTSGFTDSLSDIAAASNQLLYTTGGVLENIAPPANSIICTYNNRVFLTGMSDKLMMWYSQQVVSNALSNTIPPQFCAELNEICDPRGGAITALGLLNGVLVIFKESEIFTFGGNGPDATGNNSDFGDPILLTSDVGCIEANSVVVMPQGLMFQSDKGIYLLDQSANLSYIGAPVEAYNDLTITSATLHNQFNQVIFTTTSGTALVYDYYMQQWATWSNHYAIDSLIWNNTFVYLNPNGTVYEQDTEIFTDAGNPIFLSWTTPNLSFAGLQGYQRAFRAYILGSYDGYHTLDVSVAYDFDPNYTTTTTITPTAGYTTPDNYQIYNFRVDFEIQKCTAIRLLVADNQASNYNEGYSISSIVFEVGILPGGNRLPTTNTYGAQ